MELPGLGQDSTRQYRYRHCIIFITFPSRAFAELIFGLNATSTTELIFGHCDGHVKVEAYYSTALPMISLVAIP